MQVIFGGFLLWFSEATCRIEPEFKPLLPIIWEEGSEDFMDWHCSLEGSSLENTSRSSARSHCPTGICLKSSKWNSSGNFLITAENHMGP